MSKTQVPSGQDVRELLASLPTPIVLPDGFDADGIALAAVDEWNRRTRYLPFFQASASNVDVPYDPPGPNASGWRRGGETKLLLGNGILAVSSVKVGVGSDSVGTTLVQGRDYFLSPSVAPSRGAPYTCIEFSLPQWGRPQSIVVSGVWGYCRTVIPDSAWLGMLNMAGSMALVEVREGLFSGEAEVKDDDVTVKFAPDLLSRLGDGLSKRAERALAPFRLMT